MCIFKDVCYSTRMARKRGRPKVPKSKYKGKFVGIRVTTAEHRRLKKAAEEEGQMLAEWMRAALYERLERQGA